LKFLFWKIKYSWRFNIFSSQFFCYLRKKLIFFNNSENNIISVKATKVVGWLMISRFRFFLGVCVLGCVVQHTQSMKLCIVHACSKDVQANECAMFCIAHVCGTNDIFWASMPKFVQVFLPANNMNPSMSILNYLVTSRNSSTIVPWQLWH
jgi:hypothetical protein